MGLIYSRLRLLLCRLYKDERALLTFLGSITNSRFILVGPSATIHFRDGRDQTNFEQLGRQSSLKFSRGDQEVSARHKVQPWATLYPMTACCPWLYDDLLKHSRILCLEVSRGENDLMDLMQFLDQKD
ncbi:hypothetical protein AVEN_58032-1 [Araneus ventricosus]|uniref:Uncharacterized protein n=1 Tax=Araneus ventricosus TaxID=182803 RepID=A0A4Y2ULG8_ARAVE|nr:hypothetical protein AVEN_58032-1 [Araneus ventricosus]